MTIVVVKGERQQPVFLSDIGGGSGTPVAYSDLEIEVLDEITVTVCQED